MRNNILYTIGCLISFGLYAQEKQYVLNPAHTHKTLTEQIYSPWIYEVDESDLIHRYVQSNNGKSVNYVSLKKDYVQNHKNIALHQRMNKKISFTLGEEIHASSLSGTFERLANYRIMANNYGEFLKGELIKETKIKGLNVPRNNITLNEYNTVIVNIETGKYYFVKYDFLMKLNFNSDKITDNNERVKYNGMKIAVSRTETLTYSIEQYESMIIRCKELTTKLIVHNKLVKQGEMTKIQIKDWKRDLVEAKLLNYRIDDFLAMYKRERDNTREYVNKEMLDSYDNFSKTLIDANSYAGF